MATLLLLGPLLLFAGMTRAQEPPPQNVPDWVREIRLGGLFYLSYQDGKTTGETGGSDSKFVLKRGHVDVMGDPLPHLFVRVTTDARHDGQDDFGVHIKYAFGRLHTDRWGPVTEPFLEFGQVRLPWIFFEESIYRYRMQDGTFMDRLGLTASADRGFTAGGLLGGTMPAAYRDQVNPRVPGRRGSFAFGLYNGGGFTRSEKNENKVFQARLTLRPLPDRIPGLQVSGLVTRGAGNVKEEPDWELDALMATYETPHLVATAQRISRVGNPQGTATDDTGRAFEGEGWSLFGEAKLSPCWSIIARRDAFDPRQDIDCDTWRRWIVGIAYHLGRNNHILADWERTSFSQAARPDEDRMQLTWQLAL